jgi:hypothetical protein
MSQSGKIKFPGGSVGPILTLTPNTGGAITPVAGNINVVFDTTQPGAGKTSKTAAGTMTVDSWILGTVTTNDAVTPGNIYTLAIPNNTAITVHALVSAVSANFARSGAGLFIVGAVNDAGTVTIIGAPASSIARSPNGNTISMDAAISGTSLEIQVFGEAATVYSWSALIYYVTNP